MIKQLPVVVLVVSNSLDKWTDEVPCMILEADAYSCELPNYSVTRTNRPLSDPNPKRHRQQAHVFLVVCQCHVTPKQRVQSMRLERSPNKR